MLGLPAPFWVLWTGVLINRVGSFVLVFLTLYLTGERGMTASHAGMVVGLYGLGAMASGPVAGAISDRVGRRLTLLVATALGGAAMLQLGFARNPLHIALSTLMLGFFGESYRPAANAAVVDLVPEPDRVRAFAALYWAANLGFAAATILGGMLAQTGYLWLFLLDAATTFGFGLVVLVAVPESRPGRRPTRSTVHPDPLTPYRDPRLVRFLVASLFSSLVFVQSSGTLALDLRDHGLGHYFGKLLAINGVLIVLLQPLSLTLFARLPRHRVIALGSLLVGVGFGAAALGHSLGWYAFTICVWTLGEIIFTPVTPAVIGDLAPADLRGSYQGALHLAYSLAATVGPGLGTLLLERTGARGLWIACLVAGAISALMHLTSGGYRRQEMQAVAAA